MSEEKDKNIEDSADSYREQNKKYKMNTSRARIIRLIIYFIVVFIAAFLYSYFKKN